MTANTPRTTAPQGARQIAKIFKAASQAEGAGALVHRTIGNHALSVLDPFLLLDEFELKADRRSPGFPDHPHRGFETVTYMFSGTMTHRDNAGNAGTIGPGEVQWMTAGKGLVHSETPDYATGDVHGMQLWVNLPAKDKMIAPRYQDIPLGDIVDVAGDGYTAKLIAGELGGQTGPVTDIAVAPLYADITLTGTADVHLPVGATRTAFLYGIAGDVQTKGGAVAPRALAVMTDGDTIAVSGAAGTRFLLVAAEPIGEPVARYGPFVMTTREEIIQAVEDFKNGRL